MRVARTMRIICTCTENTPMFTKPAEHEPPLSPTKFCWPVTKLINLSAGEIFQEGQRVAPTPAQPLATWITSSVHDSLYPN